MAQATILNTTQEKEATGRECGWRLGVSTPVHRCKHALLLDNMEVPRPEGGSRRRKAAPCVEVVVLLRDQAERDCPGSF